MTKLLFVCLGNICRSPAAEAVMKHIIEERGLSALYEVDSAGTSGYHDGETADTRMIERAKQRGINVTSISRKFRPEDFKRFDYIVVMDESNYENVMTLDPNLQYESKVLKLADYTSGKFTSFNHIPDPYFGGTDGFDLVMDLLDNACNNLLNDLEAGKA